MKKLKRFLLIVLIIALIGGGGYFVYDKLIKKDSTPQEKVVNEIKGYNYKLSDNDPKVYKKSFDELVEVLKEKEIDEEAYARLVAKMYSFDFYNLSGKSSKNDVGGTEFIYSSSVNNFVLEASDTIYKYVEHNLYNDRTQTLPTVTEVTVDEITTGIYKYAKTSDEKAYTAKVTITYQENLGYPTNITVVMVHETVEITKATETTPAKTITKLSIISAK